MDPSEIYYYGLISNQCFVESVHPEPFHFGLRIRIRFVSWSEYGSGYQINQPNSWAIHTKNQPKSQEYHHHIHETDLMIRIRMERKRIRNSDYTLDFRLESVDPASPVKRAWRSIETTLTCSQSPSRSIETTLTCFQSLSRSIETTLTCSQSLSRSIETTLTFSQSHYRSLETTLICSQSPSISIETALTCSQSPSRSIELETTLTRSQSLSSSLVRVACPNFRHPVQTS